MIYNATNDSNVKVCNANGQILCQSKLKAVKGTVIKNLIQITVATFFKYKIKTCTCIQILNCIYMYVFFLRIKYSVQVDYKNDSNTSSTPDPNIVALNYYACFSARLDNSPLYQLESFQGEL